MSSAVEWALHACSLLAHIPLGTTLQATKLAEFHEIPPAYLAKHLQALARAGIVQPAYGKNGGYRLAKPPEAISLLAIVLAVDGDAHAFRCTEIRRDGPAGMRDRCEPRACAFASAMWDAEQAWRDRLANTSLADITRTMLSTIDPDERRRARTWLAANTRP